MNFSTYNPLRYIKYKKFLLLLLTFVAAYLLVAANDLSVVREKISGLGLFGAFLAGVMYSYGFTGAIATAIFIIVAKNHNIWVYGLIPGVGALIGDFIIFRFISKSFDDEISLLSQEKVVVWIAEKIPNFARHYIVPVIGGLIIASPLPDEIGVTLIAASKEVPEKLLIVLDYFLNTTGILIIMKLAGGL